jgi:hypothetical protein
MKAWLLLLVMVQGLAWADVISRDVEECRDHTCSGHCVRSMCSHVVPGGGSSSYECDRCVPGQSQAMLGVEIGALVVAVGAAIWIVKRGRRNKS